MRTNRSMPQINPEPIFGDTSNQKKNDETSKCPVSTIRERVLEGPIRIHKVT